MRSVPAAWVGRTVAHTRKVQVGRPAEVESQLQVVEARRLHLLVADLEALNSSAVKLLELQSKIGLHSAARHL